MSATSEIFTPQGSSVRNDLARAIGARLEVTAEHDGRLIADIVVEWAAIHREPFNLALTGPVGGRYCQGDTPLREIDAVDFCRILSGRAAGDGVLANPLPL